MKPPIVAKSIMEQFAFAFALLGIVETSTFQLLFALFIFVLSRMSRVGVSEEGIFSGKFLGYDFFPWGQIKDAKFIFGGKYWTLKFFAEGREKAIFLSERSNTHFFEVCRQISTSFPGIAGHENFSKILAEDRERDYARRLYRFRGLMGIFLGLAIAFKLLTFF